MVLGTLVVTFTVKILMTLACKASRFSRHFKQNLTIMLFNLALLLPPVRNYVEKKDKEVNDKMRAKVKA